MTSTFYEMWDFFAQVYSKPPSCHGYVNAVIANDDNVAIHEHAHFGASGPEVQKSLALPRVQNTLAQSARCALGSLPWMVEDLTTVSAERVESRSF